MSRLEQLNITHIADYVDEFCTLSDPHFDPCAFLVCDVEYISFHFGPHRSRFVLCLLGECLVVCTIRHSWQHTRVLQLFLQVDGKMLLKRFGCLAYAAQPDMILRCISLSRCFILRL